MDDQNLSVTLALLFCCLICLGNGCLPNSQSTQPHPTRPTGAPTADPSLPAGPTIANRGLACTKGTCTLTDQSSIRFFVVGDWGGSKKKPISDGQQQCAQLISQMGLDVRPQFFVSTGDNFYDNGVTNVDDPRFKQTFDDVFTYGKKERLPWYITQGNHDWFGNASAQVAYTWKNDRWVSPSYAFTVRYDARPVGPSVDTIYLDTIVLCGNTEDEDDEKDDGKKPSKGKGQRGGDYNGPEDPAAAERIWKWAESELARSRADYLFVVGHYPMFSSTRHNISSCLVPRLQELMEKYKVNAYLTGHAHNLQHVKTISRTSNRPIHHVLSGAGHLTNANFKPVFEKLSSNPWRVSSEFFFPQKAKGEPKEREDNGGLVYVRLGVEKGTFEFYQCNGERKYAFELEPRTKLK